MRIGSLVGLTGLSSRADTLFGIVLELPNEVSIVKVHWFDNVASSYIHIEDIEIIRK